MEESHFLLKQYLALWQGYGVDVSHLKEGRMATQLRTPSSKPKRPPEVAAPTTLEGIRDWLGECVRCPLCEKRNKIVFGSGNPRAKLMFVGEGPGANEDKQGLPFVGRAGNLLTKIIQAMGYQREEVYIANVVKCRPPENRTPLPAEVEACTPFLKAQIEAIKPQVIVALGLPSATYLVGQATSMSRLRGRYHPLPWNPEVLVMPTYHPAYLLRNPSAKRFVWADMKLVKAKLETLH